MNVNEARSRTLTNPSVRSLFKIALDNQKKMIAWILVAGGISFLCSLLSLLIYQVNLKKVHQEPNNGRKILILKRLTFCLLWSSTSLAFGASLITTQLARVLQHTSQSSISVVTSSLVIEGGIGLQVLQWLAAAFSFMFSAGISAILIRVRESPFIAKGPPSFDEVPDF